MKMAKKKAPAAKKKSEGYIAKNLLTSRKFASAPIRRLMKKEGADLVAAEALDKLISFLEGSAATIN